MTVTPTISYAVGGGSAWQGIREDLANRIAFADQDEYRLYPQLSKKPSGGGRLHEWLTDAYTQGVTTNAVIEGAAVNFTAGTNRSRVGNYQQMFEANIAVSTHLQAFTIAGIESEYAEQLRKAIVSIHKDYECTILRGTSASGTSAAAASMSGLGQIVATNISTETGSSRNWTRALHIALMKTTWGNGGRPDLVLCKPGAAVDFSTFPSAVLGGVGRQNMERGSIYDFVRVIEDPFGRREVAATNYHSTATATGTVGIWYITKRELKIATKIDLHHVPVELGYHAKLGFLESMWTLEYGHEKYHATASNITA